MLRLVISLLLFLWPILASAADARIAVASNFAEPAKALAKRFESSSSHKLRLSFASSGKLYAQILHGAPFEALLSADQRVPNALSQQQRVVIESQFTYAIGRLVLWSTTSDDPLSALKTGDFKKLSIANPRHAPYGQAALEVLEQLNVSTPHQVFGENIAQAFQFVSSGNADLGLIANSQQNNIHKGTTWLVPDEYHTPIIQDAVLLTRGANNSAAIEFLNFIQTPESRALLGSFGYDVGVVNSSAN